MDFIEYADRDMAAMRLADVMASALRRSLAQDDRATLAVPGGTTPGPVFDLLSGADLDWGRVTVLLTDERWVPDDEPRSNAGLIRDRLLQNKAAAAQFVPFYRAGKTAAKAAPELSTELAAHFPLAVCLLGMGADMHTASLFPGAEGLDAALSDRAPAVCAISTDSQPEPRITLSAPVLDAAMEKHLVIFGQDKKDALEKAKGRPPEIAPIMAVMQGGTVHWAP